MSAAFRVACAVLLGCSVTLALSACTPPTAAPGADGSAASLSSSATAPAASSAVAPAPAVSSVPISSPLSAEAAVLRPEPVAGAVAGAVAMVDGQAVAADPDVAAVARQDMPYADFRLAVTRLGWYPWPDQECRANVVGGDHVALCAQNPDLASCRACDMLPELSSCSGDGYCLMRFQMDGGTQVLNVTTLGMIEDAAVTGDDSRLRLVGWEELSD